MTSKTESKRHHLAHLLNVNLNFSNTQPKAFRNKKSPTASGYLSRSGLSTPNFSKHVRTSSLAQTSYCSQTKITDYNKSTLEKELGAFCFSEFRILERPLPKLYSSRQHEVISQKLNNLRDRYYRYFQKSDGTRGSVTKEDLEQNLKDVLLEAEKMFQSSYSVKYYGIRGDQLGVASKRVPLMTPSLSPKASKALGKTQSMVDIKNSRRDDDASRLDDPPLQGSLRGDLNNSQKIPKGLNLKELEIGQQGVQTQEGIFRKTTHENELKSVDTSTKKADKFPIVAKKSNQQKDYEAFARTRSADDRKEVHGAQDEGSSKSQRDKNPPTGENENLLDEQGRVSVNIYQMKQPGTSPKQRNIEGVPGENGGDKCLVTKYSIPRRLQTAKKKIEKPQSQMQKHRTLKFTEHTKNNFMGTQRYGQSNKLGINVEQPWDDKTWSKVVVVNQQASNIADFERKLMAIPKIKRNILRSVDVKKVWESKFYKDELDIPEKFRTHEVRKIMAPDAKYSYSKLLETMQTNEKPEVALMQNTHKMEKLLAKREQNRKVVESRTGKRSGNSTARNDSKEASHAYVVKVCYPKENEMFNRFWKIKSVATKDSEAQQKAE